MNEPPAFAHIEAMTWPIADALQVFAQGGILIVTDDEDRENEGDLIMAASLATAEKVNFLLHHGRGLLCVACPEDQLQRLEIRPLPRPVNSRYGTNFHDPVDATEGTTTGVSAAERALTIRKLADPTAQPRDFLRAGHVHTLGARPGGVLQRTGHTEATVDLCRLAQLPPAGVLVEILAEDGSMARMPQLEKLAQEHNLPLITIRDLIQFRMQHEALVTEAVTVPMANEYGQWNLTYFDAWDGSGHLVLHMGDVRGQSARAEGILIRMHSQCFTGDVLGSYRCDCGPQLHAAMARIAGEGCGVIVYLHQEGRGIGLRNKLLAYRKQDEGLDTVAANKALGFQADLREYGVGAQILVRLGLKNLRLMTNNPRKIVGLGGYGLEVVDRVPLIVGARDENARYLDAKRHLLGHLLETPQEKA
jgi:3,4-dihydroxy 2-butanone 4-phosphate synthase/GTP cyclohydrolase II